MLLLLVSGCAQSQIEQETEPVEIEEWVEYRIEIIFIEADECIKSCPVIGTCTEESCISKCSSELDDKVTDLTHEAQERTDLPPEKTNEMIFNLVEFDLQKPPAAYLACIQGCFKKCFKATCIRSCELSE